MMTMMVTMTLMIIIMLMLMLTLMLKLKLKLTMLMMVLFSLRLPHLLSPSDTIVLPSLTCSVSLYLLLSNVTPRSPSCHSHSHSQVGRTLPFPIILPIPIPIPIPPSLPPTFLSLSLSHSLTLAPALVLMFACLLSSEATGAQWEQKPRYRWSTFRASVADFFGPPRDAAISAMIPAKSSSW